ncbi:MAG TPA: XdhC family protein [Jatrophihabitans sp.]|nr:XdhC family protein [Jatrophihabitans sp.]
MQSRTALRAHELTAGRVPFVHATVVRAQPPSSAHAGDDAIVLADGSIEGFVGGQCTQSSVRTAALGALAENRAVLLRVLPEGTVEFPETPGAQVVVNPCLSGGAVEIFLEPMLPPPLIEVAGTSPVAEAFAQLADVLGYATARTGSGGVAAEATALVVASHGRDEEAAIRAALDAGVPYIALVASRKRGSAVLDALGLTAEERTRISTPAGLDIGARTAGEVAVSILAEVVSVVRSPVGAARSAAAAPQPAPQTAVDPVCGMTVTVLPDTPTVVTGGEQYWFCNPHCREQFLAQAGH